MTPQELKNSILQRAIEGKLVEQRKEEGTGEELYKLIQEEKNKLIKEGKVKKQKPFPEITEEEIPFDIPESWKWVYLTDLCNLIGGYAFKSTKFIENGIRVIRISDFNEYGLIDKDKKFYKEDSLLSKYLIKSHDILLCMTGGTVGKTIFLDKIDEKLYLNQRVAAIRIKNKEIINKNYLYNVIISNYIKNIISIEKNSTNDNISMNLIQRFLIPLPPLAEQKRIVAKIEALMPLVEEYEKNWQRLEDLNNKFPEDLKKSLLQEAIKGRLVEQRKEEGTGEELFELIKEEKDKFIKEGKIKKQKPLPEITEEEIPFDIPESWKWVRLGEITLKLTDGAHKTPTYTNEGIPFLSVKDISSGKIDYSSCRFISKKEHDKLFERCNPERGDLLLTKVGTTGIPVVIDTDEEFSLFVSVALLKFPKKLINIYFLKHLINSPLVQVQVKENTRGVGNKNWVMRDIANTIIPLPPLAEQKRIVEKLEELLPLCEQVIKN